MIAIFTMIFAGIFKAKFGASSSQWDYALYLFCGLLPWNAFQESLQLSSSTIVSHANLVKRVVFPLETLPVSLSLAAMVNQLFGTAVLLVAAAIMRKEVHPTIAFIPLILLPQLMATLGLSWFVASVGVFVRDIVHGLALLLMAWMYLTPIIYPESLVPPKYLTAINLNPFTPLVRNYRRILLEGTAPDWNGLLYFTIFAVGAFLLGYWWFARSRKSFADVV